MSESPRNPVVPLDATQLALQRTRLAYERTLMAWIRTSISLIGFGFSIYKFFQYVREQQGAEAQHLIGSRVFGMLMIGIGLFTLLLATIQHHRSLKTLPRDPGQPALPLALILAASVSVLGVLGLVAVILRQ